MSCPRRSIYHQLVVSLSQFDANLMPMSVLSAIGALSLSCAFVNDEL